MESWNVRGNIEEKKLRYLFREVKKFQYDIVSPQETKELSQEMMNIGDALFVNCGSRNRILGTRFIGI